MGRFIDGMHNGFHSHYAKGDTVAPKAQNVVFVFCRIGLSEIRQAVFRFAKSTRPGIIGFKGYVGKALLKTLFQFPFLFWKQGVAAMGVFKIAVAATHYDPLIVCAPEI